MTDPLVQACRQFEATLIKQSLLASGFGKRVQIVDDDSDRENAATADPIFGSNTSDSDILQSLYADAMAQAIASADPSGFGRSLASQLEKAKS